MSRYIQAFQQLQAKSEGAFVPFITLGDPNLEATSRIIDTLIASGADALELGLPFSDPVADGPVIQAANICSLASGTSIQACFNLLKDVRQRHPNIPIGLLVYCNLVHAQGLEVFYQTCRDAGVDSVLIADVPLREAEPFQQAAAKAGIESVFICPPDANSELRQTVAQHSQGYVYLLSRAGVTGTGDTVQLPAHQAIDELKQANSAPALLGFGISEPEHVRQAIEAGAAGAICGSAIVKIIAQHQQDIEILLHDLGQFVATMKAATRL